MLESYIAYKREVEVEPMKLRVTPYEYHMYYDC
jgi:glutamine synthetase